MINELYHYGILGMHWGIRRYQPYGRGGYNPIGKRGVYRPVNVTIQRRPASNRGKNVRDVRSMSDQELRDYNTRYQLEQQYLDNINKQKLGKRLVTKYLAVAGTALALYTTTTKLAKSGKEITDKVGDDIIKNLKFSNIA